MKEFIEKLIEKIARDTRIGRKSCDAIVQDITELAEEYKDGWIPCSERLPEESLNSVLGWDEYRNRCCFVQYISGRWVLGNDIDSVKIIAWMPLPAPYKENENDKV